MFNADDWQKQYHHRTRKAMVYKNSESWTYEYRGDGVDNVGYEPTAELAMQRIEEVIKAGIYVAKRKST